MDRIGVLRFAPLTQDDSEKRLGTSQQALKPCLPNREAVSNATDPLRRLLVVSSYFVPLGYTRILLASPVFSSSMPLAKSFIAMRFVITGCRSSLFALSSAVI